MNLIIIELIDGMKRLATRSRWWHKAPHIDNAVQAASRGRPAMEYIGIDVHKKQSHICICTTEGRYVELCIRTERDRFEAVLGGRLGRFEPAEWGLFGSFE